MTTTHEFSPTLPAPGEEPAIVAQGLTKSYGQKETRVDALSNVNLVIPSGRFIAVMGPSGSGKSTLLHCLAGLDTPTSGSIRIGGHELTGLSDNALTRLRRDTIGFVFQSFNLVPTLSAEENMLLPFDLAGRKVDRQWFDRIVNVLGLQQRLKHRPNQLSGGQQQRVAIARALLARPAVLFGDEPTGNLDTVSASEVLQLLRSSVDDYQQTVVMVTHDPLAAGYADQVLLLADGAVAGLLTQPTPDQISQELTRLRQKTVVDHA